MPGVEIRIDAEQVVEHLDLPIAVGAGADADSWNLEALADGCRDLARDQFEHNRERACLLDRDRVVDELARSFGCTALYAVATELIHRLRGQADVSHHG